jgi:hypothetical protein
VGVGQPLVDPAALGVGEVVDVDLARRDDEVLQLAVDLVPVDVELVADAEVERSGAAAARRWGRAGSGRAGGRR